MGKLKKEVRGFVKLEKIREKLPHSFDIIGHVAIIEIPKKYQREKKLIARAIMQLNRHIKTVLEKASERRGVYRTRKYKWLAGKRKTETIHKEYGALFKLDPRKVYFSPRELTERQRIASQVRPGEVVMVMFAGVAPYPIQIAKKQPKVKKVIAIEINPDAVKYARENVRINKLSDKILVVEGDVREKCKHWYGKCDRVVMPLPLGGEDFLDIAVKCLKRNGGYIHFYNWGSEPHIFKNALSIVRKKLKKNYRTVEKKKVLPYGPRKWKVCLDIKVGKN